MKKLKASERARARVRHVDLPERSGALARSFYLQPTLRVARALLGKVLVHETRRGPRRRPHRRGGSLPRPDRPRRAQRAAATARRATRSCTGRRGHAYVYFIYGMHHCMNVVTQPPDVPEAVLIRALEPLDGSTLMRARRGLADGAGVAALPRAGRALPGAGHRRAPQNGADLVTRTAPHPRRPARARRAVARTPRIGVDYAGADALRPWRFLVRGSAAVSGPRGAASARR